MKKVIYLAGNIVNFDATPIKIYDTLSFYTPELGESVLIAFVEISSYFKNPINRKIITNKFREINIVIKIIPRFPLFMLIYTSLMVIRKRIDIIHTFGYSAMIMGAIVKIITKRKLISELHGITPEERIIAGIWKKESVKYRIAKLLEKKCIEFSDHIFVVSNAFKEYIIGTYKCPPIDVIPCVVNIYKFYFDSEKREIMRKKYDLQNNFVVVFNGSFAPWDLLSEILSYSGTFKNKIENVHFLILTQNKTKVLELLSIYGLHKNDFTVISLSHEEVPSYLVMGDIGLIWRDRSIATRVSSPMKFAEYLACGLPILATDGIGDISQLIETYKVGSIVDLSSIDSTTKAIDRILAMIRLDNKKLRERCIDVAREHFSFDKYINTVISLYSN